MRISSRSLVLLVVVFLISSLPVSVIAQEAEPQVTMFYTAGEIVDGGRLNVEVHILIEGVSPEDVVTYSPDTPRECTEMGVVKTSGHIFCSTEDTGWAASAVVSINGKEVEKTSMSISPYPAYIMQVTDAQLDTAYLSIVPVPVEMLPDHLDVAPTADVPEGVDVAKREYDVYLTGVDCGTGDLSLVEVWKGMTLDQMFDLQAEGICGGQLIVTERVFIEDEEGATVPYSSFTALANAVQFETLEPDISNSN